MKKCKGINKAHGFEGCGKLSNYRKYGLCPECLKEWVKTTLEGMQWVQSQVIPKAKKEVQRNLKTEEKQRTQKLRIKATNWKDKLQTEVQLIARLIDAGLTCLARNQTGQIHGGHVFSKGSSSNIRFDLNNIHRQSAQSNKWFQDDALLRDKLCEEYGQDYYNSLEEARNTREQVKHSNEQYHEFYLTARKISNKLRKENKVINLPRNVEERKRLRGLINSELGIY